MGRTARRDALLVPYDGEISKYSGVMLRRNTLSDTGFHGVRKIDVKGGVKFQAVVFDRVRKKLNISIRVQLNCPHMYDGDGWRYRQKGP